MIGLVHQLNTSMSRDNIYNRESSILFCPFPILIELSPPPRAIKNVIFICCCVMREKTWLQFIKHYIVIFLSLLCVCDSKRQTAYASDVMAVVECVSNRSYGQGIILDMEFCCG